jgi:hypothetical protein
MDDAPRREPPKQPCISKHHVAECGLIPHGLYVGISQIAEVIFVSNKSCSIRIRTGAHRLRESHRYILQAKNVLSLYFNGLRNVEPDGKGIIPSAQVLRPQGFSEQGFWKTIACSQFEDQ